MAGIIAYCGLLCDTCPIYVATRTPDQQEQARKRAEIAQVLFEHYGMRCTPQDITDCDGCSVEGGRLFSACQNCAIRSCARSKGAANCAACSEYACERLQAFHAAEPAARSRLEEMRRSAVGGDG